MSVDRLISGYLALCADPREWNHHTHNVSFLVDWVPARDFMAHAWRMCAGGMAAAISIASACGCADYVIVIMIFCSGLSKRDKPGSWRSDDL